MYNILSFLGLIFGKLLSYFTKEEIKDGNKYFILTEKILLILIALSLLIIKIDIFSLFIFLGVIIYFFFRRISLFLGLSVVVSSFVNVEFGLLISSLVFIYLLVYSRNLKWKNIIINCLLFLIPISLIFVESFIKTNLSIFLSVIAGSVIGPVAQLGRATEYKLLKKV